MEQRTGIVRGRMQLAEWERSKPSNYLEADPNLEQVLRMHLGGERYESCRPMLVRAAELAAGPMDRLARESNRDENLPSLRSWDGIGERTEEVVFHPSYHELGKIVWNTGVLSVLEGPQNDLICGALAYLIAHNGEAGHACPVACTAGAIKLLQRVGSEEQRERYLPGLLDTDYSRRLHAAQFVTEVQGGSDVGVNDGVAVPDPDRSGWFRITGEKWFCSVIDARLFVMTARPEGAGKGTPGLGLFLVPRLVDGTLNNFSVRRLKYKLGTRSMASAEVDFDGALGEPVGRLDQGFKNLVGIVLDTSRVHNAVAATACMRRAYIEARTFAKHRVAFDRPIIEHAMVQERLARMKVLNDAALATTFRVLAMTDRVALPGTEADLVDARRTHVNLNKYWTALRCTEVVRDGIEVLGGNGTIEEFTVLPRLYRDAIVLESWEGTHNTLCAQVLRDFATRGLQRPWLAEVERSLSTVGHDNLKPDRQRAATLLKDVSDRIERLLSGDAAWASRHIRHVVDRMCLLNGYVSLLLELDWELSNGIASEKAIVVDLFRKLFVERVDPMEDDDLAEDYRRVVAAG